MKREFELIPQSEIKKIKQQLIEQGTELDKIDFGALSRKDTTTDILKNFLLDEYGIILSQEITQKEIQDKIQAQEQMQQEAIKEEENKVLKEWRKEVGKSVIHSPTTEQMIKRFELLCNNGCDVVIMIGSSGLGKTFNAISTLNKFKKKFERVSCKITPLSLFQKLYDFRDLEVILIDDLDFVSLTQADILKGCWGKVGNKRIVEYNSTSPLVKHIPKRFEITAKFIVLGNKIAKNDENVRALLSRSHYFKFSPSFAERIFMLEQFANIEYKETTQEQRNKVLNFIKRNAIEEDEINFRTFEKCCDWILKEKDYEKYALFELGERNAVLSLNPSDYAKISGKTKSNYHKIKGKVIESELSAEKDILV